MAKNKPYNPASAQARRAMDFEAVNLPVEASKLQTGADIEVTRAGSRRGDQRAAEDSARRLDAFEALRTSMRNAPFVGCYDAARTYERQLLTRRGENDRGPSTERVDRTAGLTTDAMIDAGIWIERVNARLPPRDWWLLMELLSPSLDRGGWRATVALITGETHGHSQATAVRSMTVNLRDAIERVEKGEGRRAA